jgi:hypothetical protein
MSGEQGTGREAGPLPRGKRLSARDVADRYDRPIEWVYNCKKLQKYRKYAGKFLFFYEADLETFESERATNRGYDLQHLMRQKLETTKATRAKRSELFDLKDKA